MTALRLRPARRPRRAAGQDPARAWWRRFDDVVGMNLRNAHISRVNPPESVRLVTDKAATKDALTALGVPVAPTLALVEDGRWAKGLRGEDLPEAWAMKPNQGLGGNGIMIARGRRGEGWCSPSGRPMSLLEVKDHLRFILDGEFSGRSRDKALVEPLLVADEGFARLAHQGLPDIRVICLGAEPRIAMARLPTSSSGGRANLHQGAIGAAVDLATGRLEAARIGHEPITHHPDSGQPLLGAVIPEWEAVVAAAARCGPATGLGYVGADIVIDQERGPLVLEVNARPGLQIQNVWANGLRGILAYEVERGVS